MSSGPLSQCLLLVSGRWKVVESHHQTQTNLDQKWIAQAEESSPIQHQNITQLPFSGNPLQYSCLHPIDGGAWQAAVQGIAKSRTRLSDFTFTFHFHALEKEMATHSSVLAWRIPGMEEPGGLSSMGSHRVRHD